MTKNNMPYTLPSEREFVVERVFDAPRELVWQAWTEPEHLAHWWGPQGWTLPVCTVDFRPGGIWHYCMRGPEGEESWGKATYREIVEPERIVYLDAFADEAGNPVEGMPEDEALERARATVDALGWAEPWHLVSSVSGSGTRKLMADAMTRVEELGAREEEQPEEAEWEQ